VVVVVVVVVVAHAGVRNCVWVAGGPVNVCAEFSSNL